MPVVSLPGRNVTPLMQPSSSLGHGLDLLTGDFDFPPLKSQSKIKYNSGFLTMEQMTSQAIVLLVAQAQGPKQKYHIHCKVKVYRLKYHREKYHRVLLSVI